MIRMALHGARAHARRLGLVSAAIVVGVTFMAGTLVLTETVQATTTAQTAADQPPGLDAVVFGSGSLPQEKVSEIAAVPGVARAAGVVSGYAQMLVGGRLAGSPQSAAVSVPSAPQLQAGHLVVGHLPVANDQIVVDVGTFDAEHFRIGQRVPVVSSQPVRLFTIVGVLGGLNNPSSPTSTLAGVTLTTAQQLSGLEGQVSEVFVSASPGVGAAALAARLQGVLGPSYRVLTRSDFSALLAAQASHNLLSFSTTLTALVVIALIVGAFIIFNAFSLVVAQRRRELALLRCLGASRAQLALVVTGEAAVVGLVASVVGLALGLVSAVVLRDLVQASGTVLPTGPLQLHWPTALICLAAGTGVAVVASIVPAEQAGRVPALVALRLDPVAEGTLAHPARRRLAAVAAIGGAGLVIGSLIGGLPAGVVAGVLLLVLGIAGLGQAAAAFSAGALGWPMAKVWGFTGALGRQNAVRHPGRTAASASAVVVGVALICALAIIASSARASTNDELNRTVLADYVLTAAGAGPSGGGPAVVPPMAPGVVARLRAEPGLGVVSPSSYLTFSVDGRGSDWGATIDLSTYSRVVGLGPVQGTLAGLRTGGVAVEKSLAVARGWHLGQVLSFTFFPQDGSAEATSSFPISAMFDSEGYYGGFLFSATTLASTYPRLQPSLVFVSGDPGTTPSATRLAVARALAGYPEVSVADTAEVQSTQDQVFDRQIDLAAVLSLLALIIGYLGIVTNLTLSITERVRELGLLRALGMSSRQVGAAVRFESAIIAALGALVGTALGLFVGWSLQRALTSDGITVLAIPWGTLAVYVVLAVVVGMAAGLLPARRAGRVPVLEAIAEE
jgi:putative ABC transport system permease protein